MKHSFYKKFGKRTTALILSALLTASLLAGCGGNGGSSASAGETGTNPGGEDGVFTIAYAPNESNTEAADARQGLADELSEVLGCPVEEIQASDYNAIIEALRTGSAEMAYMGSQALALGVERTDLEPIVMKAEEGDPEKAIYHSLLIAKADNSEINSIQDIQGKTMAFVDPDSTSGNLVPTAEIIQAFPDEELNSDMLHTNGDFFEAVSYSGSHQAGLQAVIKGDVDVAPISDQILASEIANGAAAEGDVKIIHE
ncbi:MAG: phosphate/phosphite/phosphonate ABC transporter substrate-binding protein, partial [Acutalibacter sp.]